MLKMKIAIGIETELPINPILRMSKAEYYRNIYE
jgi:hypothetical protein